MDKESGSILICGGSGYIGGSFALHVRKINPGAKLVVVDNLSNGHYVNDEVAKFYECDIAESERMGQIIKEHKVTAVFHFSAFLEVNESVCDPLKYYENNVCKSVSLVRTCISSGVKYFVFSSSAAVYGQPKYVPIDESHPTSPINPYGRTKLMFENVLEDTAKANKDFYYISLRYFNVAGTISKKVMHGESHIPETHLIPKILDVALGIRPYIPIFGTDYDTPDGTCIRDYIDIKDLCQAHILALDYLVANRKSDVINLGTANGFSVKEVIKTVCEVVKVSLPIKEETRRAGDPSSLIASNAKALQLLNWAPKASLKKTIERAWKWHLAKYDIQSQYTGYNLQSLISDFNHVMNSGSLHDLCKSSGVCVDVDKSALTPPSASEPSSKGSIRIFFAPGRINLIGEHIDYNGGLVLPCAINRGTYVLCRDNYSNTIRCFSEEHSQLVAYNLESGISLYGKQNSWADYVLGCLIELNQQYKLAKGFDAYIVGTLPIGAGLSSSASICISVIIATIAMTNPDYLKYDIKRGEKIALMAKAVENKFVGVSCGIMDQFIIANAKKKHAMLLNCNTLEYTNVPLELGSYCFLVCNTNVKRELRESKYNERFEECQKALAMLQQHKPAQHLAHYEEQELEHIESVFAEDALIYLRIKHVVTENGRVARAFDALKEHRLEDFGSLLTKSGTSLKYDYNVTGKNLDCIVEAALLYEGVLGARMMGAGFGGCALVLASKRHLSSIKEFIAKTYLANFAIEPSLYVFDIDEGAREILY